MNWVLPKIAVPILVTIPWPTQHSVCCRSDVSKITWNVIYHIGSCPKVTYHIRPHGSCDLSHWLAQMWFITFDHMKLCWREFSHWKVWNWVLKVNFSSSDHRTSPGLFCFALDRCDLSLLPCDKSHLPCDLSHCACDKPHLSESMWYITCAMW